MDLQSTYDRIAAHFSETREYAWPEVESFLADRAVNRAIDIGCGNGRHTELLAQHASEAVGVDLSRGLLDEAVSRAQERGFSGTSAFVHGNAVALPVQTGTVDLAVYVATLHHLSPRATRIESLNELARVLKPDGVGLVSVWSTAHDRFDRTDGFDTTVEWTLPNGETVPRYYHIYSPEEFDADLAESDLEPIAVDVSSGNCYAVVSPIER